MDNMLVFAKPGTPNYIIKLSDFGSALNCDNARYLGADLLKLATGTLEPYNHFHRIFFAYALLAWEVLQDGQKYQKFWGTPDAVQWFNDLPKDELLRSALQALHILKSATITTVIESVFGRVLKAIIRDEPEDRAAG